MIQKQCSVQEALIQTCREQEASYRIEITHVITFSYRTAIAPAKRHPPRHALAKMPSARGSPVQKYAMVPSNARMKPSTVMMTVTVCTRVSMSTIECSFATVSSPPGPASGSLWNPALRTISHNHANGRTWLTEMSERRSVYASHEMSRTYSVGDVVTDNVGPGDSGGIPERECLRSVSTEGLAAPSVSFSVFSASLRR